MIKVKYSVQSICEERPFKNGFTKYCSPTPKSHRLMTHDITPQSESVNVAIMCFGEIKLCVCVITDSRDLILSVNIYFVLKAKDNEAVEQCTRYRSWLN